MKKSVITLVLTILFSFSIYAQSEREYTRVAYENLKFQLPVGMTENREKGFISNTPDGLFGVSITQFVNNALNKKNSRKLIKEMADFLKVENTKITDVKYADCLGVQAVGKNGDQNIVMIIINSWGNVSQIVLMYDDTYKDAADKFLSTLSQIKKPGLFSKPNLSED